MLFVVIQQQQHNLWILNNLRRRYRLGFYFLRNVICFCMLLSLKSPVKILYFLCITEIDLYQHQTFPLFKIKNTRVLRCRLPHKRKYFLSKCLVQRDIKIKIFCFKYSFILRNETLIFPRNPITVHLLSGNNFTKKITWPFWCVAYGLFN